MDELGFGHLLFLIEEKLQTLSLISKTYFIFRNISGDKIPYFEKKVQLSILDGWAIGMKFSIFYLQFFPWKLIS